MLSVHSLVPPATSNNPHGLTVPYDPSGIENGSGLLKPKFACPLPGGPLTSGWLVPLL